MTISGKPDNSKQTDAKQGLADPPSGDLRRLPEVYEEIPEDAYKQNYVYQAAMKIPPNKDKAA